MIPQIIFILANHVLLIFLIVKIVAAYHNATIVLMDLYEMEPDAIIKL